MKAALPFIFQQCDKFESLVKMKLSSWFSSDIDYPCFKVKMIRSIGAGNSSVPRQPVVGKLAPP